MVREDAMAQQGPPRVDPSQVARIVGSYLRHHQVGPDQLAGLIVEVHRALAGLGRAPPVQERLTPAVPIRRSVQQDYVVCLECGYHARTLRRHLRLAHGFDIAAYRRRWNLSLDHPLIAPSYSARRSTLAKEIGLGRHRAAAEPSPPVIERPVPQRRGRRPRRPPPAT
jgi:predicted transcriptional regulator